MASRKSSEIHNCQYFSWRLYCRPSGVFYADGRGASVSLRRLSLNTKDRHSAIQRLKQLDRSMAMRHGLIPKEGMASNESVLPIEEGFKIYQEHLERPEAARGVRDSTRKRYRSVFRHFKDYCAAKRIGTWNEINAARLNGFGAKLENEDYKPRSVYLEMTTIKQVAKYLVEQKHLPASCAFRCPLTKPSGTDKHCYSVEEVVAILELARSLPGCLWIYRALVGLAYTGLRIQELAGLRWSDFSDELSMIHLGDQGHRSRHDAQRRRTKSGRSRMLPVHADLRELLLGMPRDLSRPVFTTPRGNRLNDGRLRDQFVKKVILPLGERFPTPEGQKGFKDGRLHNFRHFFCSRMAASSKVTPLVLQKWLGHTDSKMVQHYFDLKDADAKSMMSSIELLPKPQGGDGNG